MAVLDLIIVAAIVGAAILIYAWLQGMNPMKLISSAVGAVVGAGKSVANAVVNLPGAIVKGAAGLVNNAGNAATGAAGSVVKGGGSIVGGAGKAIGGAVGGLNPF